MPAETNGNLVVFTDLDGTLLDHANYQWSAAQPALEELARRGVPLVMVSSKSRIEILSLLRNFGRRDPFVVENGGAIYVPVRYFPFAIEEAELSTGGWWRISLGTQYRKLVEELEAAARAVEVPVLGFSQMSPSELADFAEFGIADARRALQREFDEAFLIVSGDQRAWPRLGAEIRRRGLRATRGTRFYHIMGENDKGAAVRRLETWFRSSCGSRVRFAGLGNSPNDIPLLRTVDVPILVARPGGHYDEETYTAVPRVRRADGVGPEGWNRAVLRLIEGEMK